MLINCNNYQNTKTNNNFLIKQCVAQLVFIINQIYSEVFDLKSADASLPPIPSNEAERLATLKNYEILDTISEQEFDDVTLLASQICDVPIALISLVDEKRQWFKSKVGISATETPRNVAFCAHAINGNDLFEVPNALQDERFSNNPIVTGELDVRFYAGMPLTTTDGLNLGTLCVLDHVPRTLSDTQRDAIKSLSRLAMRLIESRLLTQQQSRILMQSEHRQLALQSLNEITSQSNRISFNEQLHKALSLGMSYLGFEYGFVSQFDDEMYSIIAQISPENKFSDGMQMPISDTYCQVVLESKDVIAIPSIKKSKYAGKGSIELDFFEAYIGQVIEIEGQPNRVLGFVSETARQTPFDDSDIEFIQLLTSWVKAAVERQQFLSTLRDSCERDELILEATNLGTWDWHIPSGVVLRSPRWYEMLGYEYLEYDASLETFNSLTHPDDLAMVNANIQNHLDAKVDEYQAEFRMMHKDGHYVWIKANGRVIQRDKNAVPIRMLGTHMDISERKKSEELIAQKEEIVKLTGQMAKVGGWSLDLIKNELFWSDNTKRIHEVDLNYVPDVAKALEFYEPEGQKAVTNAVNHAIATGKSWDLELPFITAKNNHIWVRAQGSAIKKDGKVVRLAGAFQDITRYKLAEEKIKQLAFYDTLTKLPNRHLLIDRLEQVISRAKRNKCLGALLFIDLDNFKELNDTLGHAKGDDLLQQVANRLLECVRDTDIVARLGGDEFVVVLDSLSYDVEQAKEQALLVGNKIINTLNQRYHLGWDKFSTSPSIGVTLLNGWQDSAKLLKNADAAMYQAKADGRNCMRFFNESS